MLRAVLAVFSVSLSSLCFEVLLNRVFAITQSVHLAFFVISIAMFGYSAGSVWIHLREVRGERDVQPAVATATPAISPVLPLITGVAVYTSWAVLNLLPFDAIQLPFHPIQGFYLAAIFLLLASPFFFAGATTAQAFATAVEKPGLIYAASTIGGAAGAVLPAVLLPVFGIGRGMLLAAAFALIPSLTYRRKVIRISAAILGAAALVLFISGRVADGQVSSYKPLRQFLDHPGSRIVSTTDSISGRLEEYEGAGFHTAPGLSLSYDGPIPDQSGLFVDGASPTALYSGAFPADYRFAVHTTGALPYVLAGDAPKVLIVLESGGAAIPTALASGARSIRLLDNRQARGVAITEFYGDARLNVSAGPVRRNIRDLVERPDVIVLDHPGSSTPGMMSINEDFLLTVESFTALLENLESGGIMSLSRRIQLPPSDMLKTFAVFYGALKRLGCRDPLSSICIIRNYNMYTIAAGTEPFGELKQSAIRRFAAEHGFDLVFLSGLSRSEANRYNRRPEAVYFNAVESLAAGLSSGSDEFTRRYYIDVRAPHDDRPYINRMIRWGSLKALFDATGGRRYPFFFAGEIIIAVVFAIALILSCAIIVVPGVIAMRAANPRRKSRWSSAGAGGARFSIDGTRNGDPRNGDPRTGARISGTVFGLLGLGYMFVEIAWLKRLVPITGSGSSSFMLVLVVLLVSSGIGGLISERLEVHHFGKIGVATTAAVAMSAAGIALVVPAAETMPAWLALPVLLILVAAPGVFMGMPLPLTMRYLCRNGAERVLGWAVNGSVSVLMSVTAAGLALFSGIGSLMWIALAAYAFAFLLISIFIRRAAN